MGSTGDADRKRRHFSSISPTATAAAKNHTFLPSSEDKKLDTAVLQFQNQKLVQKLEAQKVEYSALENKFSQLKEKQQPYDATLTMVNQYWEGLVNDLESCSIRKRDSIRGQDVKLIPIVEDGDSSSLNDIFLSRLLQTDATENSSNTCPSQMEEDGKIGEFFSSKTENMLCNVVHTINDMWHMKNELHDDILNVCPENGLCMKKTSSDLEIEVKNFRSSLSDLHLKHKSLARELQSHQDIDAKNKAELKRLKGEVERTVADLEENNCKLASLKAERDAGKGTSFPVLNLGNKHVSGEKVRDKQKDLQDMESAMEEKMDQASSRLKELKNLHEERIRLLEQLSDLLTMLKSSKSIFSSKAYLLVRDQLEKSKSEAVQYQALFQKLQVEKDNLIWRERELSFKDELVDIFHRFSAVADYRITDLGIEIKKQIDEKNMIETRVDEASKEPGRKEIITEFKALVSSFPEEMGAMQSQLTEHKEAASEVHSLRADVQSLSSVLDRKVKECESLSSRSAEQGAEIQKLQALVHDLNECDRELKLILKMYKRESTNSRDVLEARDSEYKSWAHVRSLKSSLDEHCLELRVKIANEAEATSQQRLAAAEADIAELRQRLEASKRDLSKLSDELKCKNEENGTYLSEIETIGQAYDDMQNQNQHLLLQITERDDYNIKLVLEGLRAKQLLADLLRDKQAIEREIQQASISSNLYDMKAARIEDQLGICADQVQKFAEDRHQNLVTLENSQKKLLDVQRSSQQARESLEDSQSKLERCRGALAELQIELEKERFDKTRIEEDLEVARRKALRLKAQTDGSSVVQELQQELKEYKEILKCSVCLDRIKQVVITKCYHLFCDPCIQRIIGTRRRKCPKCATSFGPNDVKPVYI